MRKRKLWFFSAAVLLVAVALAACGKGGSSSPTGSGALQPITRVNVDSSENQATGGSSMGSSSISATGRYVAFRSVATNLIANDTNGLSDIFLRDIEAGTTTRISESSSGTEANGSSSGPLISSDGRYVFFASSATNLVANDTNLSYDIFVRDTFNNTTKRVSVDSSANQANSDSWDVFSISSDGRYLAFRCSATNLVASDTNGVDDIFVRDTLNNTTTRVSVGPGGAEANGASYAPSISSDGRYVVFTSAAANLVVSDTNGVSDVFVRDTQTGNTTRVSVSSGGVEGNGTSYWPSISADGRYVAYRSAATNLVAGDTNGKEDIFIRDTLTNTTKRISVSSSGTEADGHSTAFSISADAKYVVFTSNATNLVANDTNGVSDIFVRDITNNTTKRLSVDISGTEANGVSATPSISPNNNYVAFYSSATNLVLDDTNGLDDVFRAPIQ